MKTIQPAERISNVQEYYFSRKLKEVARMNQDGGIPVISLGVGGPDFMPSKETLEALIEDVMCSDAHSYQSYVGLPELRKAWSDFYSRWYNVQLDPATEMLPLIGSKEGIMHVTMAFINPGDKVLVPDPGYPTYTSVSKLCGAEIIKYDLKDENNWEPDFEALENTPGIDEVKVMWVNYPHMPTGHKASLELLRKIVDFGRRHNIVIINDNPYSFILNDQPLSILQIEGAKDVCIEFNSMSKTNSMAGWRQGICCAKKEFIEWILRVKSNVDSGMFRPVMKAAIVALNSPKEFYVSQNNAYKERRLVAEEIMKTLGCEFDPTQSGLFLWGRIPDSLKDCETLTENILQKARVFITPGFIFGKNGERFVRISLCAPKEKMHEALTRIKNIK
ncbi:MAG: aminotransferase class I/II-fold pyridoxal phosphate-dependent enzyme [Bacteroidales bacterium]|nr:aminotransferase class I/II-fold pyridoxal phosphate-dependent enzyme [Bacteroidales bacterium]